MNFSAYIKNISLLLCSPPLPYCQRITICTLRMPNTTIALTRHPRAINQTHIAERKAWHPVGEPIGRLSSRWRFWRESQGSRGSSDATFAHRHVVSDGRNSHGGPEPWSVRQLDTDPQITGFGPWPNIGVEIVEHKVAFAHAHDDDQVMLAPRCCNFRERERSRRPALGQKLVLLGHRIVIAIARPWRNQPQFVIEAENVALRKNIAVDRGVDRLQFVPPFGGEFDRLGVEFRMLDLTICRIFQAEHDVSHRRQTRHIIMDTRKVVFG